MFFMKIDFLVWLLWQLRVSIDLYWGKLNNCIHCQAIADIRTKFFIEMFLKKFSISQMYFGQSGSHD